MKERISQNSFGGKADFQVATTADESQEGNVVDVRDLTLTTPSSGLLLPSETIDLPYQDFHDDQDDDTPIILSPRPNPVTGTL